MADYIKPANPNGPVVLVSREIGFTFPNSYAYLAGYLRSQNEEVRMLFRRRNLKELVNQIISEKPVLVGLGNLYPELKEITNIIKALDHAGRKFPVVIGGQMVSPIPEFAVEITGADFGIIGEGEIILDNLVKALRNNDDLSRIKGLVYREQHEIISKGPGPFIKDMSALPSIPYDLFPTEEWLPIGRWYAKYCPQPHWKLEDRVINVHGGRGCPFTCNFCYHHSHPRYRPVPQMIDEAGQALKRFDGNMLYFSDDLVLATPNRTSQLIEEIKKIDRPVEFSVSARFDILKKMDDHLLSELKASGCRIMGLGIESGSDRILNIIGKNCTAEDIQNSLSRLHEHNILPTVSIMVGQLSETREDVEASIRLMAESVRVNPQIQYAFTLTTPFPGSALYRYIFTEGLLKDHKEFYDRYFADSSDFTQVVNLSAMVDQEVAEMFNKLTTTYKQLKEK